MIKWDLGAFWVLQVALQILPEIERVTDRNVAYADAEGMDQATYAEPIIARVLEAWNAKIKEEGWD